MMFIDYILQWAREKGYAAVYGSQEQVNEMLTSVPFADSKDGTAVVMHLVADSETYNGHDRAVVAVYFASLCPFDFEGESLLPEQERLKNVGKDMLNYIRTENVLAYEYPRWQYGYDDYAENVCWVCLRVTLTALAADCVPIPMPEPPAFEMIPLPEMAAELIKQFSGGQYEGTIRDNVLAEALANGSITVMFVGVSQLPPPSDEVDVYVTLNGVRNHVGTETANMITEEDAEQYPQLAPYIGYYGYSTFYRQASEETEFCAVIEFEGVYTSPEVCWKEEVPEPDFLNFYMPFGGTITLHRTGNPTVVELEYSTDGCRTWQIWEQVGTDRTLELPAEGRVWIRNTSETSTRFSTSTSSFYRFGSSDVVYGKGNIMSLVCKNPQNGTVTNYCFIYLFSSQTNHSFFMRLAEIPLFPSLTLASNCYRSMFSWNYWISNCDTIMATTPEYNGLNQLYRSTAVNKIVLRLTDLSSEGVIGAWLTEVNNTGDLYCDANLTIPIDSTSGIPTGWTRHDLDELE